MKFPLLAAAALGFPLVSCDRESPAVSETPAAASEIAPPTASKSAPALEEFKVAEEEPGAAGSADPAAAEKKDGQ